MAMLLAGLIIIFAGLFDGVRRVYATTGVSLAFIGFLFFPIVGVIIWLRPVSGVPARAKGASYVVSLVALASIVYGELY